MLNMPRENELFIADLRSRADKQRLQCDERAQEHQLAAGFWGVMHRGLTSTAAVAAAVAGTSLLTAATGGWRITAGILALIAAVLSSLDTTLKAAQSAEDHKRGFDGFTRMRTRFVQFGFVTVELDHTSQQLAEIFQGLVNERDELSERVPAPPQWSINKIKRRMTGKRASAFTGISAPEV